METAKVGLKYEVVLFVSDPERTRASGLQIRNLMIYRIGFSGYFLFRVAISEEEILGAREWFKDEFERRLDLPGGGRGKNDILLVVDEISNVVEGDDAEIAKLIKKIARICGQESRAFGNNPLQLKKFLNAAGKMRADGMSIDAILKAHDLPPGGRNNQNLKMLLDEQAASE